MIANTTSGKSFHGLAKYLAGKQERVDWITARNLMTDDPQLAATIMRATADQSRLVRSPVYHLSVSFAPEDHPTRAQMGAVADRLLERLGLEDRQALLVAHNDMPYAHLHMMINRVHPDTGRVWNRWRDRPMIERTCRELEREVGLRITPGLLAREGSRQRPDLTRPLRITSGERRQREHGAEPPLIDRVRAIGDELLSARSWAELNARFATHGLTLNRRFTGMVISDGVTQVKASRIAADLSLRNCERRFGERFPERIAPPDIERTADQVRALVVYDALMAKSRAAGDELQRARGALAVGARGSGITTTLDQLRDAMRGAESKVASTRSALTEHGGRHGPRPDLERMIGLAVDRMLPHELRMLQRLLSAPELAAAQWCVARFRELLLEREGRPYS
jgi:hypothetical protein